MRKILEDKQFSIELEVRPEGNSDILFALVVDKGRELDYVGGGTIEKKDKPVEVFFVLDKHEARELADQIRFFLDE